LHHAINVAQSRAHPSARKPEQKTRVETALKIMDGKLQNRHPNFKGHSHACRLHGGERVLWQHSALSTTKKRQNIPAFERLSKSFSAISTFQRNFLGPSVESVWSEERKNAAKIFFFFFFLSFKQRTGLSPLPQTI
jgi:hypothetical protein